MRFARRSRPGAVDRDLLLARARDGDDAALAALRADLDLPCADRPGGRPRRRRRAARASVLAAARARTGEPAVLEQVVLLLLDGAGRSPALVAEVLGLPVAEVLDARAHALAGSGQTAAPPGCRGWVLVSRTDVLTPQEQRAAEAHLAACRRCTAARAASAQAVRRTALPRQGARPTAGAAANP